MLSGLGVFLSTQELRTLMNHFDHNKDGCVAYDEFVQAMRVRTLLYQMLKTLLEFFAFSISEKLFSLLIFPFKL